VYHGKGGFTYYEVYDMPVTTRRYHIQKIVEYLKKKQEAEEKASKGNTQPAKSSKVNVPDFISNVKRK
jgi:hypothetical protein